MALTKKRKAPPRSLGRVCVTDDGWRVFAGKLVPRPGHPGKSKRLFDLVAEKLPYDCLAEIRKHAAREFGVGNDPRGVYIAHDSMACPRYIGRGRVFSRLITRRRRNPRELVYFSFYLVEERKHEREIETLLIRAAGPLLHFNEMKKQDTIATGSVADFEAGTRFYRRSRT